MKNNTKKEVKTTVKAAPEKAAAVKEEAAVKAETVKAEAKKAEPAAAETVKKETAVKEPAKKPAAKKAETDAKPKTARKTAAKAQAVKETVYLQYLGKEINKDALVEQVKAVWAQDHSAADVKTINLYLKPEENAAYFVVNDSFSGKIDL